MLCKLTNITLNKSYICTLEWAMNEYLGFEETLFVDIEPKKSTSKSISKRNLLENFVSSALEPQNSLINPSNVPRL